MAIKIPEQVLAWRERLRKGSIMRPKTFKKIKGKARRAGYRIPLAVAGKAYYVTLLSRYLESYPRDIEVRKLLSSLVKRRVKNPKRKLTPYIAKPPLQRRRLRRVKSKRVHISFDKSGKISVQRNHSPVVIYDRLIGIEAQKRRGKFKGENFRHDFKHKTDAMVLGNPDGSLTIRSTKGKRLWKKFSY